MRTRLFPRPTERLLAGGILLALPTTIVIAAPDRTRPTAPTSVRVTAVTSTSVTLAWNPSTDNSGSLTYTIRELNTWQTRTVAQTVTTYTWTGLQMNRTYRFLVYARDFSGNQSANSNTVAVTTPVSPPPATPTNLRVTAAGLTSLTLGWDAAAGATSYQLSHGSSTYGTTQTSYTISWLSPGTTYTFTVRAANAAGYSAWSAPLEAGTIVDTTPPTVPTVWGTAPSPGSVRLSWSDSTDDLSAVGYNVYVNGQPARGMLPDNTSVNTVIIRNLRAATTYQFSVRAYDSSGNFSPAAAVEIRTPSGTDTEAPAAPTGLIQQGPTQVSSVWLAWGWPTDNVGVTAFEIHMDGSLVGETLLDVHYGGVETWFTVRHLTPGTTHTFTVRARDEAGNVSAPSNSVTVALLPSTDIIPPSAPTSLVGSTWPNCGFLDLGWGNSTDNVDPSNLLEYEIYEDGLFRGVYRWEAFEASFGRHTYFVRAVDRSGNTSAPSNAIVLDSGLSC